jgi:preprotein translocase subunit SecD
MKFTTFTLILVLTVAGCSRSAETNTNGGVAVASTPQFTIAPSDVSAASIHNSTDTTKATVVDVHFSNTKASDFRKFTEEHLNQKVQILVGTKVVAEPIIRTAIPGGEIQLSFATIDEAQTVVDSLSKR